MQLWELFSAVGQRWNHCVNKLKKSVLQQFSKIRLRKLRSEVCKVRIEAMRQRSKLNQTLKTVRSIIRTCDCGNLNPGAEERAIQQYFLGKGCKGSAKLDALMANAVLGLSKDLGKYSQNGKVQHFGINDYEIQKERNVEEEMVDKGKCAVCARNSIVAHHLQVALLEMNEVVRSLTDDVDFISWLIAQKHEQQ